MEMPCFIDCEASSLGPDSYPTEVGWNLPNGYVTSMMINPYAVDSWTDWDIEAQDVTGISRLLLRTQGYHPGVVARLLNEDLRDKPVYSDAPETDDAWLRRLFQAAELGMEFTVVHIWKAFQGKVATEQEMWNLINNAELEVGEIHRAGIDVQRSMLAWKAAVKK